MAEFVTIPGMVLQELWIRIRQDTELIDLVESDLKQSVQIRFTHGHKIHCKCLA
jgi:hypothetical protein